MLPSFAGQYDVTGNAFRLTRFLWYRPGILRRTETNTYSAFGKLIATRVGELEVRPDYSVDGMEESRHTFRRDRATGRFTVPHRQEDSYRWQNGERRARVRTWLEGAPYDEYETITDAEGRTVADAIRQWPQLELRTVISYEGESERLLKAEVLQNDEVRATHRALGELLQPDGG